MIRLLLVPLALSASVASAAFHPVQDRPYRYETIETRTADGAARRFVAHRTVVFHRIPDGYEAVVTLDAIEQNAGGAVGEMFMAGSGALLHHPLRYRLDTNGAVLAVEDADAAVALIATAIERIAMTDAARAAHGKILASPLRALSAERKVAMVRTIISSVLAGAAADRAPGQYPITVPARPPLPSDRPLAGVETVSRGTTGMVTIAIRAEGDIDATLPVDLPGARIARPIAHPSTHYNWVRNIDAVTGLVRDSRETSEATVIEGNAAHLTQIETIVTLELAENSSRY